MGKPKQRAGSGPVSGSKGSESTESAGRKGSTGPTSPEGKKTSGQNARTHGMTAKTLVLPDEDRVAWEELRQGWLEDYAPETQIARGLVYDAAEAQWLMMRARRRYNEMEWALYVEGRCAADWSEEKHAEFERFTRYRTTAERRFARALVSLEQYRKTRVAEAKAARGAERERPAGRAQSGQSGSKKPKKAGILDQWVLVTREEGRTVTRLYPPNEKLREEGRKREQEPEMVYRRIEFVGGVPGEYAWAAGPHGDRAEFGGAGIQRMKLETWLEATAREAAEGTGHVGPTGVGNLPRPKERGECECEVCVENGRRLGGEEEGGG